MMSKKLYIRKEYYMSASYQDHDNLLNTSMKSTKEEDAKIQQESETKSFTPAMTIDLISNMIKY